MVSQRLNRDLELTRRIDDEDAAAIDLELSKLENAEASADQLVKAVNEGCWTDSSIRDPNMPYIALLAYQNQRISLEAISTLLNYWSARQLHGDILQPLTPDHPNFKRFVVATLRPAMSSFALQPGDDPLTLRTNFSSQLTDAQLDQFFEELTRLPKSQQIIFAHDETIDLLLLSSPEVANVTDKLTTFNFTPLGRSQILYRALRLLSQAPLIASAPKPTLTSIVPSLGIMQLYLDTKFSKQAVRINPVIGLSTLEDIRQNGLTASRDMALHFPKVKLPDNADGFTAHWYHFTWHDFYHAFAASAIPDSHRKTFVSLSDIIKQYVATNNLETSEIEAISNVANTLIDMEHSFYRSLYTLLKLNMAYESPLIIFLLSLTITISKHLMPHAESEEATSQSRRTVLSKETTEQLFNVICEFLHKLETISPLMSESYEKSIHRNFHITRNTSLKGRQRIGEVLRVSDQIRRSWQKLPTHSPRFFAAESAIVSVKAEPSIISTPVL